MAPDPPRSVAPPNNLFKVSPPIQKHLLTPLIWPSVCGYITFVNVFSTPRWPPSTPSCRSVSIFLRSACGITSCTPVSSSFEPLHCWQEHHYRLQFDPRVVGNNIKQSLNLPFPWCLFFSSLFTYYIAAVLSGDQRVVLLAGLQWVGEVVAEAWLRRLCQQKWLHLFSINFW